MKTLLVALCAVFASAAHAETTQKPTTARRPLTKEELAARKQAALLKLAERNGGLVIKPGSMQGKVVVFGYLSSDVEPGVRQAIETLRLKMKIDVSYSQCKMSVDINEAQSRMRQSGATFALFLVSDSQAAFTIASYPEQRFGFLNLAKVSNLKEVIGVEFLRAFAHVCGAAASQYNGNMMDPITRHDELARFKGERLPLDVAGRCQEYLKASGVTPYFLTNYRRACTEGWAMAPTNDVQKAIWDEVHALPSDPIKIKFDPKRDK